MKIFTTISSIFKQALIIVNFLWNFREILFNLNLLNKMLVDNVIRIKLKQIFLNIIILLFIFIKILLNRKKINYKFLLNLN